VVNAAAVRAGEPSPGGDEEFRFEDGPAGRIVRCTALESLAEHLFTTRQLELRGDSIEADYTRIGEAFATGGEDVVRVRQVHGRTVLRVEPGVPVIGLPEADAIVSSDSCRPISVRIADCVPVLLADREGRAVAAIHAGWRGAAAGIIAATIEVVSELDVRAADLVASVGPAIGPCCYQVDEPVRSRFRAAMPGSDAWFAADDTGWRLDLWAAARDQLMSAGLRPEAIHVSGQCTAHQPEEFFSYRRDGAGTGRMVAAIRLGRPHRQPPR
jgi:YfiH family protein